MRTLGVHSYNLDDIVASDATRWDAGTLLVDVPSLTGIADSLAGVRSVGVSIVRRGDATRIVNVIDVVEPVAKRDDPSATFPGHLGHLTPAGIGVTHRLDGMAVVSTVTEEHTLNRVNGFIDMAGPGAPFSYWSRTCNLVLSFECEPQAPLSEVDRSVRFATLSIARTLAASTIGRTEDRRESLTLEEIRGELPTLCVILQVASEGPGADTYVYGAPAIGTMPIVMDAREILDGAVVSGAYDHASVRNPTYFYQRSRLLTDLIAGHGIRWWLRGVILTLGYLNGGFEKERAAMLSAKLAEQLGADAAILTTFSSGNSHTDTMLTCRACESRGIRTAVILAESNGGLTDFVPEADCIINVGNQEELVEPWAPDRLVGGRETESSSDVSAPVPLRDYVGATCQLGDMSVSVGER